MPHATLGEHFPERRIGPLTSTRTDRRL